MTLEICTPGKSEYRDSSRSNILRFYGGFTRWFLYAGGTSRRGRDAPHGAIVLLVKNSYLFEVSATEIIKELPKLTEAERRAVRLKLLELDEQDEQVRSCNESAVLVSVVTRSNGG